MATFVEGPVRVSVPATSANLGPGFDSLGLALDLRDRLEAEVLPEGLVVEVDGAGADEVPLDETHLVVRAMRAAFEQMDAAPAGLRLTCTNVIPHARGLGSSSAAIVGGLSLARALVAGGSLLFDDDALFALAARIEGHPDNVAPAFYGGFVISGRDDEFYAVRSAVDPRVSAVVLVPPDRCRPRSPADCCPTRCRMPTRRPTRDAPRCSSRRWAASRSSCCAPPRDYLHQDYRRAAMPDSLALVDALRADGVPAVISGAGPTVLAFTDGANSRRDRCSAGPLPRRLDAAAPGRRHPRGAGHLVASAAAAQ